VGEVPTNKPRRTQRTDLDAIADQIVKEWKDGASYEVLRLKYKCGSHTIERVIRDNMPWQDFRRLCHQRVNNSIAGFRRNKFRPGRVPLGTIRLFAWHGGRYRFIKIANGGKKFYANWQRLSVYNWEKVNGKVPKDHVVLCVDGNRKNDDISNLTLVHKSQVFEFLRQLEPDSFYGEKWKKAVRRAADRAAKARLAQKQSPRKRRSADEYKEAEEEDRMRVAKIREIIPVPACVKERLESGWWDNREDDDE